MDSLFDQDSAPDGGPSAESPPIRGAGAATLGQGDTESVEEEGAENGGTVDRGREEPDRAESVGPGIDGRDDAAEPAAADGAHPTASTAEAPATEDRTGDRETGSAEVPAAPDAPGAGEEALGAGDDHAGVGSLAEQVDGGAIEREEEHVSSGQPEPVTTETPLAPLLDPGASPDPPADAADAADATAPPAWHLPPPPRAVPEPATAWAPPTPAGPPEAEAAPAPTTLPPGPFSPAAQTANAVSAAPSSAGPAPSGIEPPRLAPARLGRRLVIQLRLLARWPAPVRATPDQRGSSLVMLFLLAVTVGVVGAGILVGLAFAVISALGHG